MIGLWVCYSGIYMIYVIVSEHGCPIFRQTDMAVDQYMPISHQPLGESKHPSNFWVWTTGEFRRICKAHRAMTSASRAKDAVDG